MSSTELAPVAQFTFMKKEQTGEPPKFDVTDARGEMWVIKVGYYAVCCQPMKEKHR